MPHWTQLFCIECKCRVTTHKNSRTTKDLNILKKSYANEYIYHIYNMDRSAYSASCNGLTAPFLFPPFLCEESWKPKTQQTMTREAPKQKISIICMNEWKQLANSCLIVLLYEESLFGCSWHILHKRTKTITVNICKWWIKQNCKSKEYIVNIC